MASYHLCPSYLKQETGEASAFCYAGSGDLANASVLATALTERDEGTRSGTDPAETGQSALDRAKHDACTCDSFMTRVWTCAVCGLHVGWAQWVQSGCAHCVHKSGLHSNA